MSLKTHNIGDMVADGLFADEQLPGDIPRRFVLDQQLEDFTFPVSQQKLVFVVRALQWLRYMPERPHY